MMKRTILSMMLAVVALCGFAACGNKEKKVEKTDANTEATQVINTKQDATTEATQVNSNEQDATTEAESEGLTGQAPDFTLNDINGNPLSLSSLRGKYVILDFWGSWCGWCIRGIPAMKEYYAKYAGKFEILGIDCNDSEEKWKEAVKKYELPWLHVYWTRESSVLTDYAIEGFPTKIVVGPDGNIVKTIVGEDPAFYEFLDELFGK